MSFGKIDKKFLKMDTEIKLALLEQPKINIPKEPEFKSLKRL